jgi:hypothetical protein
MPKPKNKQLEKNKFVSFQLTEPVFKSVIYIIVNVDFEGLNKIIEKRLGEKGHLDEKHKDCLGIATTIECNGKEFPFVWVKDFHWTLCDQATLNHELLHACLDTIFRKNMEIKSDNPNETLCYLFEYYSYEAIRRLGKVIK